ncbi:MAG: class I SAM-dependent methyltransferase [Thermodesulfobacteriota bacterium]
MLRFKNCPCCANTDFLTYYRNKNPVEIKNWRHFFFGNARYIPNIYACRNCGFKFINELPGDYERFYQLQDLAEYRQTNSFRADYFEEIKDWVEETGLLNLSPSAKILDLGCGDGVWLGLWRHRASLYGTEISAELKEVLAGNDIILVDYPTLGTGPYDLISMFDFLEHVEDPLIQLRVAYSRLRPGGLMVIGVPDLGKLLARICMVYYYLYSPMHFSYFSKKSLRYLVESVFGPGEITIRPAPKMHADLSRALTWLRFPQFLPKRFSQKIRVGYSASLLCLAQKGTAG